MNEIRNDKCKLLKLVNKRFCLYEWEYIIFKILEKQ